MNTQKLKDIIEVFAPLVGAAIIGGVIALVIWGGASTDEVRAIYNLGKGRFCWDCEQRLSKDAPAAVVRFHATKACIKEGRPW